MTRRAACSCGQLHLTIEGEPSPTAMCHCLECQRRTGAVLATRHAFALNRFPLPVRLRRGARTAESGSALYGRYLRAIYDSEAK